MKTDEQLIGDIECICGALTHVNELIRRYRALKVENEAARGKALEEAAGVAEVSNSALSHAEVAEEIRALKGTP